MPPQSCTLPKPTPTYFARVGSLPCVSRNVPVKISAGFKLLATQGTIESDGICGMFLPKVPRHLILVQIRFITAGEVTRSRSLSTEL